MKWSEFKKLVDKELKGKDPEIFFIDTTFPSKTNLEIVIEEKGLQIYDK